MILYFVSCLLALLITTLVLFDSGSHWPAWYLPALLPALSVVGLLLFGLRQGTLFGIPLRRRQNSLPTVVSRTPLANFASQTSQPAVLVEKGRIAHANRALLKGLGMPDRADDLIGMPLDSIVHPKHHERLALLMSAAASNVDNGIFTLLCANGMPWRTRVNLFRGDQSNIALLQFTAPESDQIEVVKDPLWQGQFTQYASDILFAADSQLLLTSLSPQWERSTGRKVRDTLFAPLLTLFHTEDRPALMQELRLIQSGERVGITLEARLLSDGATGLRWVEIRAWSVPAHVTGESSIMGLLLDITQRKRDQEALRAQRRGLHTMLDNLPGMIYRGQNDRDWSMEFVSEGCYELTGYTPLELIDHGKVSFADLIHPEDREFVWNFVQMRLSRRERYELNYRIIDRDGEIRWVWEQGRGIHSSRGEFLGLEGFITDVSSSREAQEEARRRLFYDNATGLVSYTMFLDRLQHLFEHAQLVQYPFMLMHLSLDIAEIAQQYGAAMPDRIMLESGKRLSGAQSHCNIIARHDAHGFVVLLSDFRSVSLNWPTLPRTWHELPDGMPTQVDALMGKQLCAALVNLLARPLRIEGHTIHLKVSGLSVVNDSHFQDINHMLQTVMPSVSKTATISVDSLA